MVYRGNEFPTKHHNDSHLELYPNFLIDINSNIANNENILLPYTLSFINKIAVIGKK